MSFRRSQWTLAQVWLAWILMFGVMGTTSKAALAQTTPSIPTTPVLGTIYTATGSAASGTALINWPAFTTWAGASVPAGSTSVTLTAGGSLSVRLVPNAGSTPMGSYYTVVYHLSDGSVTREYWVVPVTTATVAVSAIKSTVLPTSVAMQTVSKSYVDTAIAAAVVGAPLTSLPYVQLTGDTMTGPLVLPADPTSPLQASDKNYVDTQVAGLASGLGQKVSTSPAATQTVSQPSGTQLAVNDLNGVQYASQYATGAGNNGIANAAASCTSGCEIAVEQTYPSAENVAPRTWSNKTHVEDKRGGATTETFLNPLPPLANGNNAAKTITVESTQTAQSVLVATGSSQIFSTGMVINSDALAGGSNVYPALIQGTVPYFKTTFTGLAINGTNNTLGQHVLFTEQQNCYGVGDCLLGGMFMQASGGFRDDADEGSHPFDRVFTEDTRVFTGTCASGCSTGSTLLQIASIANNGTQGEGRYLVNTNPAKAITGGVLTGAGAAGGRQPSATFSGVSFPVSVFLATAQTIPTQSNSINPGTVTVPIATSALPAGFANNTAALPATSGVACVSDVTFPDQRPLNFETAAYTVVDGTHLQLTLIRPHANGATVAAGGLCGYGLEQKVDTVNGIRQVFPVIGSPNSTSLLYAGGYSAIVGVQGLTSAYINASLVVASISRTGNVITVTTTSSLPQDLNGLTMNVQSVSDSSYNGSFLVTTTGPNTITYANSGPNSTSSGGSLTYITGSYGLYPMAEVLNVYNSTTKAVDGQMTLAANNISWATGDTVEQPHYFQEWVSADTEQVTQYTPRATRYQSAGVLYNGNNGSGLYGWQINNSDPASSYFGNGGTHTAPTSGINVLGVWNRSMEMQAGEGTVFDVHCNSHGCNRWNSSYDLFQLDSATGADRVNYSPKTSTMTYYLGGTGYTFSPSGLTAGTINATTVNASSITGSFTGQAATVGTISGLVAAGSNVTVTGSGTTASPYTIAASSGGSTLVSSANVNAANPAVQVDSVASSTYYGLDCFGDSYMYGAGATTPAAGQCALVAADLNIASVTNAAVPGDTSADLAYHVLSVLNPVDSGNPIVIAAASVNNVGGGTAALPNFNQNTYAAYAWGTLSSTNKILVGASGVTSAGTTAADTTFASANGKTCSTGTCTFTYSGVVGQTGVVYLWYVMRSTGGTISATVDGATATDTVTNATAFSSAWSYAPANNSVSAGMARYVTTPGTHTIVISATSGATVLGFGFPTTARIRGVSSPRMFMGGTAKLPASTLAATQIYNNASIAVSQRLVGDGLDVPFVDLLNAYNPNLDFVAAATQNCPATTQGNHPNNCGHRNAAGVWEANINAVPTAVSGTPGGPVSVGSSLFAPASDGAPANTNLPTFWQMPSRYTDSLIPKLDFGSNSGCNFGAGQAYDTNTGLYGTMLYGCSGKAIQFAYADALTPSSTNANFHVSDYITLPDGYWHGTGALYTGSVAVGTTSAVSGAALTVNGLTSGNGWSNGANTTPIYNYTTVMGTQAGAANDEEVFTNSTGTISMGSVTSGTFTPWMKLGPTSATLPATVTVGTSTPVSGAALTVNGQVAGNGWSNGANTTPIYNYTTSMGTQAGAANDEQIFTTSSGTVSLGQVVSGTFTPWATAGSSTFNVLSKRITNLSNAVALTDAVPLGQLNGPLTGNLTLTSATTDNVTILGLSTTSKCSYSATNATAAGVAGTLAGYYTLAMNTFTLHHVATSAAGATYGVVCSVN